MCKNCVNTDYNKNNLLKAFFIINILFIDIN